MIHYKAPFRLYVEGVKLTVISHHPAFQYLKSMNNTTGRLAGWALRQHAFDFGSVMHVVPDVIRDDKFAGKMMFYVVKDNRLSKSHRPVMTYHFEGAAQL